MNNKSFSPYGPEWEKQMMKLSKKVLIQMLRDTLNWKEAKENPEKKEGRRINPWSSRMLYGLDVG